METDNKDVTQERALLQSKVHAFVNGGSQDVSAVAADCRKLGIPVTDAGLAEIVSDTRRCIREVRTQLISEMVSRQPLPAPPTTTTDPVRIFFRALVKRTPEQQGEILAMYLQRARDGNDSDYRIDLERRTLRALLGPGEES